MNQLGLQHNHLEHIYAGYVPLCAEILGSRLLSLNIPFLKTEAEKGFLATSSLSDCHLHFLHS
jgi:hypothetical protein